MRKMLLSMVALTAATTGFAQTTGNANVIARQLPTLMVKHQVVSENAPAQAVKRSQKDGVYYAVSGGLWKGWNMDGRGTGYSTYVVAPWTPVTFYNRMGNPTAGEWTFGNETAAADGEGNFVTSFDVLPTGYFMAAPTLANNGNSWNFGANNLYGYYAEQNPDQYGQFAYAQTGAIVIDSIDCLYPTDDHAYLEQNGRIYSNNSAWGSLDNDNMYGTGTYTANDTLVYVSTGLDQAYTPLASPLYVEQYGVKGSSFSKNPIAENDTLWAYVTGVHVGQSSSGVYVYTADSVVTDVLYATAADTLGFSEASTRNGKTIYQGTVLFSKKTVDAFGTETVEPFVIPAGKAFCLHIVGFDQKGVDFGPFGLSAPAEDEAALPAVMNVTDGKYISNLWYSGTPLNAAFIGMFDKVKVHTDSVMNNEPEGIKYNILHISADGKTVTTEGATADFNLGAVPVSTATEWFDGENSDIAFYDFTDLPDWVSGVSVYNGYRAQGGGLNMLQFEFQPLPEGVNGRSARVYVKGRDGIECTTPIYLLQGDATIESGINDVKADSKKANNVIYNLKGQQVSKAAKGILIQNGKKFFNK